MKLTSSSDHNEHFGSVFDVCCQLQVIFYQNMAITLTLVQHNTKEELWLKCLETCEECSPVQQGFSKSHARVSLCQSKQDSN